MLHESQHTLVYCVEEKIENNNNNNNDEYTQLVHATLFSSNYRLVLPAHSGSETSVLPSSHPPGRGPGAWWQSRPLTEAPAESERAERLQCLEAYPPRGRPASPSLPGEEASEWLTSPAHEGDLAVRWGRRSYHIFTRPHTQVNSYLTQKTIVVLGLYQ